MMESVFSHTYYLTTQYDISYLYTFEDISISHVLVSARIVVRDSTFRSTLYTEQYSRIRQAA